MSRPAPSVEPAKPVEDIRADFARRMAEQDPDNEPGYLT